MNLSRFNWYSSVLPEKHAKISDKTWNSRGLVAYLQLRRSQELLCKKSDFAKYCAPMNVEIVMPSWNKIECDDFMFCLMYVLRILVQASHAHGSLLKQRYAISYMYMKIKAFIEHEGKSRCVVHYCPTHIVHLYGFFNRLLNRVECIVWNEMTPSCFGTWFIRLKEIK